MDKIDELVEKITTEVVRKLNEAEDDTIMVEASGRHVHLKQEDVELLFGKGYKLTVKRELSQPGQFLSNEKVTLIGPRGVLQGVSILGPVREKSQVELSLTDGRVLGINLPVRMSGDLKESAPITIAANTAVLRLSEGAIAAKRHIHLRPVDAERLKVHDNQEVSIEVLGERGLIFNNVIVRVSDKFKPAVHLDYDEANACGYNKNMKARIVQ